MVGCLALKKSGPETTKPLKNQRLWFYLPLGGTGGNRRSALSLLQIVTYGLRFVKSDTKERSIWKDEAEQQQAGHAYCAARSSAARSGVNAARTTRGQPPMLARNTNVAS